MHRQRGSRRLTNIAAVLAEPERAKQMTGRIEHHSQLLAVSIGRLRRCLAAPAFESTGTPLLKVVHLDLECNLFVSSPDFSGHIGRSYYSLPCRLI